MDLGPPSRPRVVIPHFQMSIGDEDRRDNSVPARGGRPDDERLLEDTRRMLENTRAFLERIREGEEATQRYIEELRGSLENEVRRLESRRPESEGPPAEPEPRD